MKKKQTLVEIFREIDECISKMPESGKAHLRDQLDEHFLTPSNNFKQESEELIRQALVPIDFDRQFLKSCGIAVDEVPEDTRSEIDADAEAEMDEAAE